MVLNYTVEQYTAAAKIMREIAPAAPDDHDEQACLVAASACEEVLKLAEQNRTLRSTIGSSGRHLLDTLEHLEQFS